MTKTIEVSYSVSGSPEDLAQRAASYFRDRIREAVTARGRARIAISGGSTPKRAFELLATAPYREQIPWEQLDIFWVDERCVPPDNPDSNYRMTREALLDKVFVRASHVFRIHGEFDPLEAAVQYEADMRRTFGLKDGEMPVFDTVALGMGPDGHTASLFPHTAALHETRRIAVANHVLSQKDAWRVTLTWPVINQARDVFFLIQGADKAAPLRAMLLDPYKPEETPSQLIQPNNGRLAFLLDSAAAASLPQPDTEGYGRLEITR